MEGPHSETHQQKYLLFDLMALCSTGLGGTISRDATRRLNNDAIELEVKTATWLFENSHGTESTG